MCIFKTLVESHKESFRAEDIYNLPCFSVRNGDGKKDYPLCDRLNLECDKRTKQGKCGVSFKAIEDALKELYQQGILKPEGEGWVFVP